MATARVLLVDDEPMVRNLSTKILTRHGYEVIATGNGEKALEVINKPTPFDVVISDAVMPGIQGPELLEFVREASPSTALVLMSAYMPGEVPDGVTFLRKPFSSKDLIAAVELTLENMAKERAEFNRLRDHAQRVRLESRRLCEESAKLCQESEEACRRSRELIQETPKKAQSPPGTADYGTEPGSQ
jgi:DNA-binding NtrC family response regulator